MAAFLDSAFWMRGRCKASSRVPVVCLAGRKQSRGRWKQFNHELRKAWDDHGAEATVESLVNNRRSSVQNFNQVVTLLLRAGEADSAVKVVRVAFERGQVDELTFRLALRACAKVDDASGAREIWKYVESSDLPAPSQIARDYFSAVAAGDDVKAAGAAFAKERARLLDPDEVASMAAIMVHLYAEYGRTSDAVQLIEEFEDLNFEVDVYNTLISTSSRAGEHDVTQKLYEIMRERSVEPDIATYNAILRAFHRAKRYQDVETFWAEMIDQGLEPTLVTYNTMMNFFVDRAEEERALELFDDITARGLQPDRITFTTLIRGFGRSCDVSRAVQVLHALRDSDLGADRRAYQTTVNTCLGCADASSAQEILEEMRAGRDERRAMTTLEAMKALNIPLPLTTRQAVLSEIQSLGGFFLLESKLNRYGS